MSKKNGTTKNIEKQPIYTNLCEERSYEHKEDIIEQEESQQDHTDLSEIRQVNTKKLILDQKNLEFLNPKLLCYYLK